MTKNAINYSLCKMYKIVCKDLNVTPCYVGHTTNFVSRKYRHKTDCNSPSSPKYNYKIYKIIRENGGWENFSMVFIEDFPCTNVFEATKRERELYEELNATMNSNVPNRSKKEYQAIKHDCDCGGCYINKNKGRHFKTSLHQNFLSCISIDACKETEENSPL